MGKAKRTPAKDLVVKAKDASKRANWYQTLSVSDRKYVDEVATVMSSEPDVSVSSVAMKLMHELDLKRSRTAVIVVLQELINAKT